MNAHDLPTEVKSQFAEASPGEAAGLLLPLLQAPTHAARAAREAQPALIHGVVVGELLALTDNGQTPDRKSVV